MDYDMRYLPRLQDLGQKAWSYGLAAMARPRQLPYLLRSVLKGAHLGEFLKINQPWIKQAGVRTVIDIGAHNGEFSTAIRAVLPGVQVYAFEPLPDSYEMLTAKFREDPCCRAFRVALGDEHGQVKFWRSRFSKSSSVLPMADIHKREFPWSSELVSIDAQMATLDDFLHDIKMVPKVLINIDVQGYEDRVIRGGVAILRNADYVLTEVSFRRLYEGQTSFDEIYQLLKQLGFSYAGNVDQLLSPGDRGVLQADALFVRETAPISQHQAIELDRQENDMGTRKSGNLMDGGQSFETLS
jgi:FkbM family methyltransferase